MPFIYQSHDIAVFPFIEDRSGDMEGFGLVMVEAMGGIAAEGKNQILQAKFPIERSEEKRVL